MTRSPRGTRFTIRRSLGEGGFAQVVLAHDQHLGCEVALKRPRTIDAQTNDALIAEFAAIAPLEHPGLARALDLVLDPEQGGPALVFEWIDGVPSTSARQGATPDRILRWTANVVETLIFLHGRNLLHGDLKPENILIDRDDLPRLLDLGLARPLGSAAGGGTIATAAPEVLLTEPAGPSADLFSFGATLFYWWFGRAAFPTDLRARLAAIDRVPRIPSGATVPGGINRLLRMLLQPRPEDRLSSAVELAAQLAALSAPPPHTRYTDPSARGRGLRLIGRNDALGSIGPAWDGTSDVRLLWLSGPASSGRTRLLDEAATKARLAGRRVVRLRGADGLDLAAELLAGSSSFGAGLAALLETGPVTITIDDADRFGPKGASELAQAATLTSREGDLVVIACGALEPAGWQVIPLRPLDRDEIGDVTRLLLPGPPLLPEVSRRLHRVTAGQVGTLITILSAAIRDGLVIDRGIGGWDLSKLERSPLERPTTTPAPVERRDSPVAEHVLAFLTISSEPLPTPLLAELLELPLGAVATAVRELIAANAVQTTTGGALLAGSEAWPCAVPAAALHARLLISLARRGPGPALRPAWLSDLARHAFGAGDPRRGAALLLRAVGRALVSGRPDLAAAALAVAPVELEHDAGCRRDEAVGEVAMAQGRPEQAAEALERAAQHWVDRKRPERAARCLARLARALGEAAQPRAAAEAVARGLALARTDATFGLLWLEQGILAARRGVPWESLERCEAVLEVAPPASTLWSRAHATRGRCLVLLDRLADAEEAFLLSERAAEAHGDVRLAATVRFARLQAALHGGRTQETLERVPETRRLLLARADADGLALLAGLASRAAQCSGDWLRALAEAESAVRWREIHGRASLLTISLLCLARVTAALGDLARARGYTQRVLDAPNASSADQLDALALRAQFAALAGDAPSAAQATAEAERIAGEAGAKSVPVALAAAWSSLAAGDRDAVVGALERVSESDADEPGEWPWNRAQMLALVAWGTAGTRPAEARRTAARARALADRIGDLDSSLLSQQAEEDAAHRDGDDAEANRVRTARLARMREVAGRLVGSHWSGTFLSRPDRACQFQSFATDGGLRDRLAALYQIVADLSSRRDPNEVIDSLLSQALQVIGAERGAVILVDDDNQLRVVRSQQIEPETARDALQISRSVISRASGGESILALEPAIDPRFKGAHSVKLFSIRAVLCVPLRLQQRTVGVLYIDSRDPTARFSKEDLPFAEALADHAALALDNARRLSHLISENEQLKERLGRRDRIGDLVTVSSSMQTIAKRLELIARSSSPVLIEGETGTGKEFLAGVLHRLGPTPDGPLIRLPSSLQADLIESTLFGHVRGAFTGADRDHRGLLLEAHGGTLLLDEVGELPPAVQTKLLAALDSKQVTPLGSNRPIRTEFRLISATAQDLEQELRAGRFRRDLWYRIVVQRIAIPPLRERPEDLPQLCQALVERLERDHGPLRVDQELIERFANWGWPGNVRELENVLTCLAMHARSGIIDLKSLAAEPELARRFDQAARSATYGFRPMREVEREHYKRALEFTNGNRERAAKILGVGRATLFRKILEYGLADIGRPPPRRRELPQRDAKPRLELESDPRNSLEVRLATPPVEPPD